MTDYTELIRALRCCGNVNADCTVCPWDKYNFGLCAEKLYTDAAAAIEALQAEVDEQKQITAHYEQTAKDYWKEACEYHAIVSAKDITAKESEELIRKFKKLPCGPIEPNEPKRGEIVRCRECIHFTQGGWCDREFDWFPVDENDFCSMAEKMEVQDGE